MKSPKPGLESGDGDTAIAAMAWGLLSKHGWPGRFRLDRHPGGLRDSPLVAWVGSPLAARGRSKFILYRVGLGSKRSPRTPRARVFPTVGPALYAGPGS